jgi:hypothetical protein
MQGFSRLVAYDNSDGYRAGHSLVYGGGVRYRLWRSLLPSVGLLALHRLNDTKQGAEVSDAGGDWLYLTPGLGYMVLKGPLAGLSLNIVGQIPLFQHLNGTQLAEDFSLSFAVAYGFQLFGAPVTD